MRWSQPSPGGAPVGITVDPARRSDLQLSPESSVQAGSRLGLRLVARRVGVVVQREGLRTERRTFFDSEGSVMLHELAGGDLPEQCGGAGRRPWAQAVGDVGGRVGRSIRPSGDAVVVEAATDGVPPPRAPAGPAAARLHVR
jgi:hypothetical protein